MTQQPSQAPQFFLTAPSTCPYLPEQQERKVFTHLVGDRAPELNDLLTQGGFRRSQNIAYRPACETCRACISVRILSEEFQPTKGQRRILKRNGDLTSTVFDAEPTTEQYSMFRAYLDARHASGGMAEMSVLDYAMMVEDSHVDTKIIEYRLPKNRSDDPSDDFNDPAQGELIAAALTDVMADGLSMVYSFFEPDYASRSLGTYLILDHIFRAREMGLPHVYLGYWVKGSSKMAYKAKFRPQEHLMRNGWERYEGDPERD